MSLKNQLESLLFSSGKAMEEEQLASLTDVEKKQARKALKELQKDYAERDTALKLYVEGAAWKLLIKDEYVSLARRIVADTELSKATLETLAVIAYHQPTVLQSKVVDLRGGNAYEHIKELVDLGFVTKSKEGRSYALRLTEKFFDYFDVEGGDSIKQVFKHVTPPKERQKQLGGLQVVDELPLTEKQQKQKEEKELLGGLPVIDELPEPPVDENGVPEAPGKMEESTEEKEAKVDFLEKIEAQIDSLSKKNDERDDDEDFKPSHEAEETGPEEEEAAQTATEESQSENPEEESTAEETPEETQDSESQESESPESEESEPKP